MPDAQITEIQSQGIALNSWTFLIFCTAAILVATLIRNRTGRNAALLIVNSFFLYTFISDITTVVVLAGFILATYFIGISRKQKSSAGQSATQLMVVAALWIFLFFARDSSFMSPVNPFSYFPIQLIGLSYMTFRSISYVMEVEFIEKPSFFGYCNYILFFPLLLAGPIERYQRFEEQLSSPQWEKAAVLPALHRIANGLFKKFVIADNLAVFGILAFDNARGATTPRRHACAAHAFWHRIV